MNGLDAEGVSECERDVVFATGIGEPVPGVNLDYSRKAGDPIHRKHHQNDLTFRMLYAYNESFVMPLSHDEVVQGKGPLWDKMAGDEWQKFAGMRLLFAYQWGMTGKKLIFMGDEIAQRQEWRHDQSIDWHQLQHLPHRGVQGVVRDLNKLYANDPAMHELDNQPGGFSRDLGRAFRKSEHVDQFALERGENLVVGVPTAR